MRFIDIYMSVLYRYWFKKWKIWLHHLFQYAFLHEQMITFFTVKKSVSVHRKNNN